MPYKPIAVVEAKDESHTPAAGLQQAMEYARKQGLYFAARWACRVANRPEQSWEDIRLLDSSHPLIQCADMITGAVADHANHNDDRWLSAISAQMAVLWHERFEMDGEKRNSLD